jgi:hypothetical protein
MTGREEALLSSLDLRSLNRGLGGVKTNLSLLLILFLLLLAEFKKEYDGPGVLLELSSFILLFKNEKLILLLLLLFKMTALELFEFVEIDDDDTEDEVK